MRTYKETRNDSENVDIIFNINLKDCTVPQSFMWFYNLRN